MVEKRKSRRYPKRYRVKYGETDFARSGFTENISATGLFVLTTWMPKLGTLLCLEVTSLDEKRYYFQGEVKRLVMVQPQLRQMKSGGFGARFLTPGELLIRLIPRAGEEQATLQFDSAAEFVSAFQRELSHGGVVIKSRKSPAVNTVLQVQFQLSFVNEMLEVTSRVVQVGPAGPEGSQVAVVFSDKESAVAQLKTYLPP